MRKSWSEYEAVLLIETYRAVQAGRLERADAVAALSHELRTYIEDEEVTEIDEKYRNEAGIKWQYAIVEKILTDQDTGGLHAAKVFRDVCAMYLWDKEKYGNLLMEIKDKNKQLHLGNTYVALAE